MPVRVKVDEDLPGDVAEILRAAGHNASSVMEQSMSGIADEKLWEVIVEEGCCLVTADKGFADIRKYSSGSHSGIVLFRLPRESRAGYIALARLFLERFELQRAIGRIVVATPAAIRVHST